MFALLGCGNGRPFGKGGGLSSVLNAVRFLALIAVQIVSAMTAGDFRSIGADEAILSVADQIRSACAAKRIDDDLSVFGSEILKKSTLLRFFFLRLGNEDGLFRIGI